MNHPATFYCPGSYRFVLPADVRWGPYRIVCPRCERDDVRLYSTDIAESGVTHPILARRMMAHFPVHPRRLFSQVGLGYNGGD